MVTADHQQWPWYAIRVRSRCEQLVSAGLRARGFEEFLPRYWSERTWSDRRKRVEMPLFPGYVFCRLDVHRRQNVVMTPGVVSIVGCGSKPEAVPEDDIQAVCRLVDSGILTVPFPFMRTGQRVVIERGPLCGLEGTLVEVKSRLRLVVSIEMLQRSVAAEVDRSWVRPIESRKGRKELVQSL